LAAEVVEEKVEVLQEVVVVMAVHLEVELRKEVDCSHRVHGRTEVRWKGVHREEIHHEEIHRKGVHHGESRLMIRVGVLVTVVEIDGNYNSNRNGVNKNGRERLVVVLVVRLDVGKELTVLLAK
jgi:hypothetical protein